MPLISWRFGPKVGEVRTRRTSTMAQEVTTCADFMQAGGMFVIELTYKAPLAEIDAHMKAHVVFLKKYYAAGHFLVSGRQIPREGGIILAIGESRQQIETIMSEDPFCRQGLADFRVVEFRASQSADDMPKRIGA